MILLFNLPDQKCNKDIEEIKLNMEYINQLLVNL